MSEQLDRAIQGWTPYIRSAMGYDACDLSFLSLVPYASLLGLLIIFAIRYRAIIFRSHYQKRNKTPTRLCKVTAAPWEAILALTYLLVPRFVWAGDLARQAVQQGAWETRDLSGTLGWVVLLYLVAFDFLERYGAKKLMRMYRSNKNETDGAFEGLCVRDIEEDQQQQQQQQHEELSKEAKEDQRLLPAEVESQQQQQVTSRFSRIRTWVYRRRGKFELSSANMLTQLHLSALIKAILIFTLMSQTAITTCWFENRLDTIFDTSVNLFLPLCIASGLQTIRLIGVICRSTRFGLAEVDLVAVNSR